MTVANTIPGPEKERILLADDHSMIRRGLKIFLHANLGFHNIGEVTTCSDLLQEIVKKKYTHLILDILLKDGNSLEIIPNIRRIDPDLKIMIFSMQPSEIYGPAVKQYGIVHYMHKGSGEDDMLNMLKVFLRNDLPNTAPKRSVTPSNPFVTLAPRELEILHYILKGYGTKNIGETLNLRMSTVSTVKTRIFEKTKANNLKELLELAALYNVSY